jgi:hypothetical protein
MLPAQHSVRRQFVIAIIQSLHTLKYSGVAAIAATGLLLGGCGGGGGGGSGSGTGALFNSPPEPAQYTGSRTAANLSAVNAEDFAASVLLVSDTGAGVTISSVADSNTANVHNETHSIVGIALELLKRPSMHTRARSLRGFGVSPSALEVAQDETFECLDSGTVRERIEVDNAAFVSVVTEEYRNCAADGELLHGTIVRRGSTGDPTASISEVQIPALRIVDEEGDITISGAITARTESTGGIQTIGIELVMEDNDTHESLMAEGFQLRLSFVPNQTTFTQHLEIAGGRIFLSEHGFVEVRTENPLVVVGFDLPPPVSGGPIVVTGSGDAQLRITPRSASEVLIELDPDGNGVPDRAAVVQYAVLGEGVATPSPPIARIAGPATSPHGVQAEIDGSVSSDPNNDLLVFTWSLEGRPAGSTSVLDVSKGWAARFVPDRDGEYRISLTVSDGTSASKTTHLLTAINLVPVASGTAGEYSIATVGETVPLDGSASSDGNSDPLTFQWSFRSRPDGSSVAIQGASDTLASFVPDKPGLYELELRVDDGFQGSDIATVTIATAGAFAAVCNTDEISGMPQSGLSPTLVHTSLNYLGQRESYAALCSGWFVAMDTARKAVSIQNIFTGREKFAVQLPDAPQRIAYDYETGKIYASYSCSQKLSIIDLATNAHKTMNVPGSPIGLAPAPGGRVYLSYQSTNPGTNVNGIAIVNGTLGTIERDFPEVHGLELKLEPASNMLFAERALDPFSSEDYGFWCDPTQQISESRPVPTHLTRYQFNGTTLVVDETHELPFTWAISPNGEHFASRSASGDTVDDRVPTNLNVVQGTWNANVDFGATFHPRNKYLALFSGPRFDGITAPHINVFDVSTYAKVETILLPTNTTCGNGLDFGEPRFSPGGKILFGRSSCHTGTGLPPDILGFWVIPNG